MDNPCSKEINFVRCMKCMKIFQCSRHDTAHLLEHIRTDHPEVYSEHQSKSKSNKKMYTSDGSTKSATETSKINYEHEPNTDDVECQCGCNDVQEEDNKKRPLAKDIDLTQYSITSEILDKYPEIQNSEYIPEDQNTNRPHKRRYKINSTAASSFGSMHTPQKRNLYRTSIEKWRPGQGTIYCPKCGCTKRPLIKTRAERVSSNQCGACCLLSCWPLCFLPCLLPGQDVEYLYCCKCKNFLGIYDRNSNCIKPNRLYVNDEQPCQEKCNENTNCNKSNRRFVSDEQPFEDMGTGDGRVNSEVATDNESERLPSVIIDGKEVPPETVARLKKYKRLGSLAGFDLDAYTDKASSSTQNRNDPYNEPGENIRKENTRGYA